MALEISNSLLGATARDMHENLRCFDVGEQKCFHQAMLR